MTMYRQVYSKNVVLSDGETTIPAERRLEIDDDGNPKTVYVTTVIPSPEFWKKAKEVETFTTTIPMK